MKLPWQVESFRFPVLLSKESPEIMHGLGSDATKFRREIIGKLTRKQRGKMKMERKLKKKKHKLRNKAPLATCPQGE